MCCEGVLVGNSVLSLFSAVINSGKGRWVWVAWYQALSTGRWARQSAACSEPAVYWGERETGVVQTIIRANQQLLRTRPLPACEISSKGAHQLTLLPPNPLFPFLETVCCLPKPSSPQKANKKTNIKQSKKTPQHLPGVLFHWWGFK